MKHVVIVGHPTETSFNLAEAHAYEDAAHALGHEVLLRDLYRLNFDPRLQDGEVPRPAGFAPDDWVREERARIADADVFAFVYPLWFNMPPAIIVGYVQRIFGMGFGYSSIRQGGNRPLLPGRRLFTCSTSGAPLEWVRTEGAWDSIRNLLDDHLAEMCGLTVIDHLHMGRVLSTTPKTILEAHLRHVGEAVKRRFGPPDI